MQSTSSRNKSCVLIIALTLLAGLAGTQAASVSLQWNPGSAINVTGYNIYYGTSSGDYKNEVTVGNVSGATISNLTCGAAYYFAATAVDSAGDESGFSNEATFTIPGILTLSAGANPGDPMLIKFPVAAGHWYEVQASVDLQSWSTIWQTDAEPSNTMVQFSDPAISSFPSRFYRLAMH
jgi:Fibronectin type III domain